MPHQDNILRNNYNKVISVSVMQQHYIKNLQSANEELKQRLAGFELQQQMALLKNNSGNTSQSDIF